MSTALPDTVCGKITRLVAGVVVGVFSFVASAAMAATLPQSSNPVRFDAGHLKAAAFIGDSPHAGRQGDGGIQQATPFGMEAEPDTGGVAAKWRAVEFDIHAEQHVLAACRTGGACPAA